MAETYGWPEGTVYLWTGSATSSAVVAYAQNVRATLQRGWDNYQTLDGLWHDRHTGQRADVQIGALLTRDNSALNAMFEATAVLVHMHLIYDHNAGGSAGRFLYSGKIDALTDGGGDKQSTTMELAYHCNLWTAYP